MSTSFAYQAYDSQGAKLNGTIVADTKQAAISQLEERGLFPIEVKSKQQSNSVSLFKKQVSLKDLEFFTSELSLLLRSGLRIDKAIAVLAKGKSDLLLRALLEDLLNALKGGQSLSQAFRNKPEIFDPLYCNLIELGEETGNLSEVFSDLAKDLAFRKEFRAKVIAALTYPSVIFAVCVLSIFFIFNVIIPKMSDMFSQMDNLPWYTQMIIGASNWMQAYQIHLMIGLGVVVLGLNRLLQQPEVNSQFQRLLLRLPVTKSFVTNVERIRFNSALAMMLRAGISIDKAMKLAVGSIKNSELQAQLNVSRNKIKNGASLTESLGQSPFFSGVYISLLEVGEQTGTLDIIFDDIAKRSKVEFEAWTTKITTLLEPLMILFMGGVVGSVVVVMLLSMVSINSSGL
ncbi:type II secretion system F family protein [Pseudoalteromonas xiamenensis]